MTGAILLIGDDKDLIDQAGQALEEGGYRLAFARVGPAALGRVDEAVVDLVILAVQPGERGWSFCRRLLASCAMPLLLIVVGGDQVDQVQGLELGTDDCVAWPLLGAELAARVRALLRTAARPGGARRPSGYYADKELVIDLTRGEVMRNGEPVRVTATELRVLACFVRHVGEVVSHERLAAEVWAPLRAGTRPSVYPHVRALRLKLEADPARPRRILTRHGQGYLFVPLGRGS